MDITRTIATMRDDVPEYRHHAITVEIDGDFFQCCVCGWVSWPHTLERDAVADACPVLSGERERVKHAKSYGNRVNLHLMGLLRTRA